LNTGGDFGFWIFDVGLNGYFEKSMFNTKPIKENTCIKEYY
jgi:hypothetical protein